MKSAVDVDDASVQQMVEESVAHAFDDLAARRWIETKLKATDTLAATRRALATCADDIDGDYRDKIISAAGEVERALGVEDSLRRRRRTEAVSSQSAVAALDEVTQTARGLFNGQSFMRSDAEKTWPDTMIFFRACAVVLSIKP